ncbi:hypothetical protein QWY31_00385 [Cytophagales bacterium LB-30]|uniref:Uncharacterized protein n=2 Tax=Shiella aurantiaca TaxID=3058365 RepID=A0ABT8F0G3_9BACT|nr:hypothetical protein [Shiella aurantiaca]
MKQPYALYIDARKLDYLSSDIRIAQGKFFKDYKTEMNTYCIGAVMLVKSPFAFLMHKAISVLENPPGETYFAFTETEALKKTEKFLNKIKVTSS